MEPMIKRKDFSCQGEDCCGHSYPVSDNLLEGCRWLNDKYNGIYITSGFRCKRHNETIPGAAKKSYHTIGIAADIYPPEGVTPEELYDFACTIPFFKYGGIGIYDWGIHVDDRKYEARWDKRTKKHDDDRGVR
jgi:uncharacterized protein YcbK (DUF882 family)